MNSPTFLALASLAAASALALSGCTVHTHAEWHSGTSRSVSTGSEQVPDERSSAREPRRSNAGRGRVVRVTTSDKNVNHSDGREGRDGREAGRSVVRVSGPAPAGSSGDDGSGRGVSHVGPEAGASAGEGSATAGAQDSSPPEASGSAGGDTAETSPAPGADDAREADKGTFKHENEPHVARPIKRPNKGPRRVSEDAPLKGGRRE